MEKSIENFELTIWVLKKLENAYKYLMHKQMHIQLSI